MMTTQQLQQVKSANPIEHIAARYARLHRAGSNYKMLCPFHDDHHPSLALHVAGQYFKCHACGAGGDVIALVQGLEKCSFTEAVGLLTSSRSQPCSHPLPKNTPAKKAAAEKAAAESPHSPGKTNAPDKTNAPGKTNGQTLSPQNRQAIATANEQFLKMLLPCASGHTELSPAWLDFEVGISPAIVPPAFHAMRSRLIFPIRDAEGVLTGFGARRIDKTQTSRAADTQPSPEAAETSPSPKYINTANNGLYEKSRTLYGIHRASDAIRSEGFAFIVEGYKDVLAMHAAGFCNTVALCGTALADGQVYELSLLTSRLVLLPDGDKAGRQAAARIRFERAGKFSIHICLSPTDEDPDELFRRLGRAAFRLYIRLLTDTGSFCARRLLFYCLSHPQVAAHTEWMLETDDFRFAHSHYNDLLHALALSRPPESYPENLALLASFLHSIANRLLPPLPPALGIPSGMLSEASSLPSDSLADRLRLEYYEERTIASATLLRKQINAVAEGSKNRQALLLSFRKNLGLLKQISRELERTPAIEARWFT